MSHNLFNTLREFKLESGKTGKFYSLPALEKTGVGKISRLPVSIRIVLESVLRNVDGKKVTEEHVKQLANWQPNAARVDEIPFVVARILLEDFTGVPLLADLAAMRGVAHKMGKNPKLIEPLVPVDLVVDHSVQVDHYGTRDALDLNMKIEFQRNTERYQFMKWGMQAFDTFKVVPPGIGIVHQVNLEYLARGVHQKNSPQGRVYYPDTLVGTDSHTTMINGIGVVGWGVGGIEAEAGMLGQPVYFLTPDVVGVNLAGRLREGVTATDLVLTITEMLRKEKVVGKFVEFFGEGTASLAVRDRATIANMAPEYGATMGFFPVDDATIEYFKGSGRTADEIDAFCSCFKAQGLFGIPKKGQIDYSKVLELDLASIKPSVAGPKRPQDRIELGLLKNKFIELFSRPVAENGFAKKAEDLSKRYSTRLDTVSSSAEPVSGKDMQNFELLRSGAPANVVEMVDNHPTPGDAIESSGPSHTVELSHGDVLIAAITSCTNTSNPGVLLAAGLLAKKAVDKGLTVKKHIKTSLAPGSRVVTEYLQKAGLLSYLEQLGFTVAAYGCTTCIGNAGPLTEPIEETIVKNDLVCSAVLSGNRNFEARIHPNLRANFLASPPLVVAFAIAGTVLKNLESEPLGTGKDGKPVYLKDIWPTSSEVHALMKYANDPATFRRLYSNPTRDHQLWNSVPSASGQVYDWPKSTYIAEPPFFKDFALDLPAVPADAAQDAVSVRGASIMALFGDSITTDH
ncbi:MAG TPA: aconitate hydratase AcnA, partial [Burkholderiales bacterium]|nr:aconitate hydratase AcnA [Burkholderiales bacterium]